MEGAGLGTQTIWVGGEPWENERQGCYGLNDLLVGCHGNQAGGRGMVSRTKLLRERMKLSLVGLRDSCGHEVAQSGT